MATRDAGTAYLKSKESALDTQWPTTLAFNGTCSPSFPWRKELGGIQFSFRRLKRPFTEKSGDSRIYHEGSRFSAAAHNSHWNVMRPPAARNSHRGGPQFPPGAARNSHRGVTSKGNLPHATEPKFEPRTRGIRFLCCALATRDRFPYSDSPNCPFC